MNLKRSTFFACLVCLILASTVFAQDDVIPIKNLPIEAPKVVRLYSSNLPPEVNLQAYVDAGEIKLTGGLECKPPAVVPTPAPPPYPQPVVWEKGIEQLGPSAAKCDGIWFITGNNWQPRRLALVLWKIRIPEATKRLGSEFGRDLTLSLWIDSNENKMWDRNEKVLSENFNIKRMFPTRCSTLEIWYLTCFFIPPVTSAGVNCGRGMTKYETKLWVRGALSYDDPDVSPAGQALFGEFEDYQMNYYEIRTGTKTKG
jgi:hypothetical protein